MAGASVAAEILLAIVLMQLKHKDIEKLFKVTSGRRIRLKDLDPAWAPRELQEDELKARARDYLKENLEALTTAQGVLWANDRHSVLVVLQAMDGAGKDGVIRHVMGGVNPQGCQVFSFKKPSDEELDHNFLWRFMRALPERGRIGIFNRSYYEDVLVVRVHPELLERQKLPAESLGKSIWKQRFDDINAFERHLVRNGTLVLKFFLHMSKKEQRRRFIARLDDPDKQWKFSNADIDEREHWDAYQTAFEDAINQTGTKWAPWWVIPADRKYVTRALISTVITHSIEELGLKMPVVPPARQQELVEARRRLDGEKSKK